MDFCKKQVKSDCEELLNRFQQTASVRFEIFAKIWREMKFSDIFHGTMKHEKRRFSRLVLDSAYGFFLPPFSFQIRVGALYLLYSFYHCQSASPPEQIRLALKDWEDLKKFEKDALNAQHHDAVYILHRLMFLKALVFTAMPTLLVFKKKRGVEPSTLCEEFMERTCRPQELVSADLLEELSAVHDLYEKTKTSVCSGQASSSVGLIRHDLVPRLRGTVMDFYKWQQRKLSHQAESDGEEDAGGEGTSSQQDCSRRAERLALIKSKAYGQALEAPKSRRHRQVEVDFTSSEAGPTRTSKPSLKSRISESLQVSGDVWKGVSATTYIHCLTTVDSAPDKREPLKRFKWM